MRRLRNNIPQELQELKQWVCYSKRRSGGKVKKFMVSPVTSRPARSNIPSDWTDFDTALGYMTFCRLDGVAFALNEGVVFIDLDHAYEPELGAITDDNARELLNSLPDTYAEFSTSGTGIHIFCKGALPPNSKNKNGSVEMYDHARFACFTGNVYDERCRRLADYSYRIGQLAKQYVGVYSQPVRSFECKRGSVCRSDQDLIDRIRKSRQGAKFDRLLNGDTSAYPSHSEADSALVWILAAWTRQTEQIDRIFRASGLYREKWDRHLNDMTYGQNLIDIALSKVEPLKCSEVY